MFIEWSLARPPTPLGFCLTPFYLIRPVTSTRGAINRCSNSYRSDRREHRGHFGARLSFNAPSSVGDADAHPATVVGNFVDPVGDRLAEVLVLEVVRADPARLPLAAPVLATVLVVADQLLLTVLGGLAEFERKLIRARTGEGRARARARGVKLGRRPDSASAARSHRASRQRRATHRNRSLI
jgi:hypothetical protein